ncbi:hypothetical protein U9M48_029353 [Paspalum notatum var. saurae]|uniref:Uncharacterized protein n=1 Tax=Paspalum notatum var. saurae TaxID=547442 RepID=A0AAQ3X202_PASNO
MGNVEVTPSSSVVPEGLGLGLGLGDALVKVAVFAVVQALVYLILRKSSDVFAPAGGKKAPARSFSFRPMRSMSVRRVLAAFSDVPVGVPEEPSVAAGSRRRWG